MRVSWAVVTGPAVEPITLVEAKAQARIRQDQSNATIVQYIKTAREAGEAYMNRGFYTQTMRCVFDRFYAEMWLPRAAPLQSVTKIEYYDTSGVLQTLSASVYTVDTVSRPGKVVRASAQAWPALQADRLAGRVVVTYVVGWATTAAIPERIKQGIRMYVTYLDRDRDGTGGGGDKACEAAEACWNDVVSWIEPQDCEWA